MDIRKVHNVDNVLVTFDDQDRRSTFKVTAGSSQWKTFSAIGLYVIHARYEARQNRSVWSVRPRAVFL